MPDPDMTPTETPEQPAPHRRLVRLPSGAPVAGVAAGLGAYFGVDPVVFRIAFAVLAFAGGSGLLLYGLGWLLIPVGDEQDARPTAPRDDTTVWIIVGVIAVVALVFAGGLHPFSDLPVWALVLLAVGVLLFREDQRRRAGTSHAAAVPPTAHAASALPSPPQRPETPSSPGDPGAAWQPPEVPPSPPSMLGRATVGGALLATGIAALLDNLGVIAMHSQRYLALVLTVIGLGLLVGAWRGRARGLIIAGLVMLPLLAVTSAVGPFPAGPAAGTGQRLWTPASVTAVEDAYTLFAGDMHVDLSSVDFSGETVDVATRVTFGEILVTVPADVTVEASGRLAAGEISLLGHTTNGTGVDRSVVEQGREGAGRVRLDLAGTFGQITVRRAPTPR